MATQFLDKKNATTEVVNRGNAAGVGIVSGVPYINPGSVVPLVTGVNAAGGLKIVGGTGTLDGGNPTTIETGLTTVIAFVATKIDTDGVGTGTAFLTHGAPTAGAVPVYAWVVAGTASTGTETFSWIAIGT
jgi:hypothetical protein